MQKHLLPVGISASNQAQRSAIMPNKYQYSHVEQAPSSVLLAGQHKWHLKIPLKESKITLLGVGYLSRMD